MNLENNLELQELIRGKPYTATIDLSTARSFEAKDREPDIKIRCNTLVVLENEINNLSFAFSRQMMDAPFTIDKHKHDNLVIFRMIIEGIWLSHSTSSDKSLKIVYGNDIWVDHSHRNLFVDIENHPPWTRGTEQTAPAANTTLVSKTISTGAIGYIYGFEITAEEANQFLIKWNDGTARQNRIIFNAGGSLLYVHNKAYNEGEGAVAGSNITIENVNAGTAGKKYSARLLVGEQV